MQKWEYCTVEKVTSGGFVNGVHLVTDKNKVHNFGKPNHENQSDVVEILNQLGREGWEVVGTIGMNFGMNHNRWIWTLKRLIEP